MAVREVSIFRLRENTQHYSFCFARSLKFLNIQGIMLSMYLALSTDKTLSLIACFSTFWKAIYA